jgi:protein phosphatase methylesterase 1
MGEVLPKHINRNHKIRSKYKPLTKNTIPIYWKGESGPNIVCLHGAGHSAQSFAPLAGMNNQYRLIAFDFRNHGFNETKGELSQDELIGETIEVLNFVDNEFPEDTIIVVGHSMGGSVATKAVSYILKNEDTYKSLAEKINGLIVIDVVEGTAMEALPFMESIVINRPNTFESVEGAIEYMYKSGTIKNLESVKISVPSLVKKVGDKKYQWKTDLLASQKYWTGK